MILSFSTKINGKPTMFTNKIVKCMWEHYFKEITQLIGHSPLPTYYIFEPVTVLQSELMRPKLHTIREDHHNRWFAGRTIDFFIYPRTNKMFRFAPRIKVLSTQTIEIIYSDYHGDKGYDKGVQVLVDDVVMSGCQVHLLAINDGFESVADFFAWFSTDFTGKIIHWTNLKYNI